MKEPGLDNLDLAYETGLHIGDGNLVSYPPHYRYVLSGNRTTEFDFYATEVVNLVKKLYGLSPHIFTEHNSVYATTYSKPLVLFKVDKVGLPVGPKDQLLRLPRNITCGGVQSIARLLSGLFDTDGSPKIRTTSSGVYPRISFAQKVRGVVEDVGRLLTEEFAITNTVYRNDYFDRRSGVTETRWFLDINGFENLSKFNARIGSRHPRVRRKLRELSLLRDPSQR